MSEYTQYPKALRKRANILWDARKSLGYDIAAERDTPGCTGFDLKQMCHRYDYLFNRCYELENLADRIDAEAKRET